MAALMACALSEGEGLPKFRVEYLLEGYTHCLGARLYAFSFSQFVPGILKHGDITDIVNLCGDRIDVGSWVGPDGRVV